MIRDRQTNFEVILTSLWAHTSPGIGQCWSSEQRALSKDFWKRPPLNFRNPQTFSGDKPLENGHLGNTFIQPTQRKLETGVMRMDYLWVWTLITNLHSRPEFQILSWPHHYWSWWQKAKWLDSNIFAFVSPGGSQGDRSSHWQRKWPKQTTPIIYFYRAVAPCMVPGPERACAWKMARPLWCGSTCWTTNFPKEKLPNWWHLLKFVL